MRLRKKLGKGENNLPISRAPYKRTYKHTKRRGRETLVRCDICGRKVPRYKTFIKIKGLRITDQTLLKQVDRRLIHLMKSKLRLCPACARFRGIVQPGKAVRRKRRR